jgi:hypothetical protein
MSADYGTKNLKGFHHHRDGTEWIHVTYRREDSGPVGDFSREDIAELVELAEQAWPGLAREMAIAAEVRKERDDEEGHDDA